MKLTVRVPATAGLMALLLVSATGCKHLMANDQINKGVADFKSARYESATNRFQKAAELDPDNPNPRIYLATTYSSQVVPNLDTPENKALAQKALDNFRLVLDRDPNNVVALKQIASIDLNIGKVDEAKNDEKKVIALAPGDSEAWSAIGGIDWRQAYKNAGTVLGSEGIQDKSDGNVKLSKAGCAKLIALNTPVVTEGLDALHKAVDLNPTYDEAMTFLSLTYRRKADLECGNLPAIKDDLANADQWTQKAMGARKAIEKMKEDKSQGITQ